MCIWSYSAACPRDPDFVGRPYLAHLPQSNKICHRFTINSEGSEQRSRLVMEHLERGIV